MAKVYLPYGQLYYLCRHCHDLVYRSSQEHDKGMDRYKRMSTEELLALIHEDENHDFRAAVEVLDRMERVGRRF